MSETKVTSLAILMTCHNRRETTLRCLNGLHKQVGISDINLTTFVVDDGSTDGTSDAIKKKYPNVRILKGDGTLYWTRGMHKAMSAAMNEGFNFYLWLNDDVQLYKNALDVLLSSYRAKKKKHGPGIVIGSLCDPDTGEWTYGASRKTYSWYPLRFNAIIPNGKLQEADNFYGNVVLIPNSIARDVGTLDQRFQHGGGDHDYALRARDKGYKIWNAPCYLGECARNSINNTWEDSRISLLERYRKMFSRKAMPPKTRYYYTKKHGGLLFPFIFLSLYIKLPFIHILSRLKKSFKIDS